MAFGRNDEYYRNTGKYYRYMCMAHCKISTKAGNEKFERIINNPNYEINHFDTVKEKGGTAVVIYYSDPTKEIEDYVEKFGEPENPARDRLMKSDRMLEFLKEEADEKGREAIKKEVEEIDRLIRQGGKQASSELASALSNDLAYDPAAMPGQRKARKRIRKAHSGSDSALDSHSSPTPSLR